MLFLHQSMNHSELAKMVDAKMFQPIKAKLQLQLFYSGHHNYSIHREYEQLHRNKLQFNKAWARTNAELLHKISNIKEIKPFAAVRGHICMYKWAQRAPTTTYINYSYSGI